LGLKLSARPDILKSVSGSIHVPDRRLDGRVAQVPLVFFDALVGQGIAGSMPQHRQAGLDTGLFQSSWQSRLTVNGDPRSLTKMNGLSPACAFFEVREA
jgi:hypothetical protein